MTSRNLPSLILALCLVPISGYAVSNICSPYEASEVEVLLNPILKRIESDQACHDLAPGESFIFQNSLKTGTYSNYLLERDKDAPNKYTATINYNFNFIDKSTVNSADVFTTIDPAQTEWKKREGDFRAKVQQCFDETNPRLLGPKGEKITLKMLAPGTQAHLAPPPVTVHVYNYSFRQNSLQWSTTDINCPVIIHESLHHLGLCDTYQENSLGYHVDAEGKITSSTANKWKQIYDCRSIGEEDSIMTNHFKAFEASTLMKRKSILYPGEFYSIIQKDECLESNKYAICSRNAYSTSYGESSHPYAIGPCKELPEFCKEKEKAWLR